jgi:hypothetical protein
VVDYNFLQLSIKCTILWFGILFTLSTYFSELMLSHKKFRKERKNEFHFKLNTKKVR